MLCTLESSCGGEMNATFASGAGDEERRREEAAAAAAAAALVGGYGAPGGKREVLEMIAAEMVAADPLQLEYFAENFPNVYNEAVAASALAAMDARPPSRKTSLEQRLISKLYWEVHYDQGNVKQMPRRCEILVAQLAAALRRSFPRARRCRPAALWTRLRKMLVLLRHLGLPPDKLVARDMGRTHRLIFELMVTPDMARKAWRMMFGDNPKERRMPRGTFFVSYWPHTNAFFVVEDNAATPTNAGKSSVGP